MADSESSKILYENRCLLADQPHDDTDPNDLPIKRRETTKRIFVNRLLNLKSVKFYGFDMDYTLAIYKSPYFESYVCKMVQEKLVAVGYPEDILKFSYNHEFPIRGLWFDKEYGNFLKVDSNHNILLCIHGFTKFNRSMIESLYTNAFVQYNSERYVVLDSLFNLPEIYLLAALVDYFTGHEDYEVEVKGVTTSEDVYISYEAIFQDVRANTDLIHHERTLKEAISRNLSDFIVQSPEVKCLLARIRDYGAKTFLLTNSDYWYTNIVMPYLLDTEKTGEDWKQYFDYIVVDAKKPTFFSEGTPLRKFDSVTGKMSMGHYKAVIAALRGWGLVSQSAITAVEGRLSARLYTRELIGATGKDVLYVGDHIYGDIIRSKKQRAWRTFLIIPELENELQIFHMKRDSFLRLDKLYAKIAHDFRKFDSTAQEGPDVSETLKRVVEASHAMDRQYGLLGSLFRKGPYQTQFASQVSRYADIYATSSFKLLNYPFFYLFRASPMLLPHESTVNPDDPYHPSHLPFVVRGGNSSMSVGDRSDGSESQRFEMRSVPQKDTQNADGVAAIVRERTMSGEQEQIDVDDVV